MLTVHVFNYIVLTFCFGKFCVCKFRSPPVVRIVHLVKCPTSKQGVGCSIPARDEDIVQGDL